MVFLSVLKFDSSSTMKSAMSSSSSGSDRASASASGGAISGNDIEESKSKSTSRMSCASDDSCAINELLEGRMDLAVTLPNSANPVVINVERRTPMLDLLVNISTQYRFNAANYTINAGGHEFKASTPIGTLDVNQISVVSKSVHKSASVKSSGSTMPFQTTFRLQVNLPRNQLMVMRVSPNATIAAIKQIICTEKALDANKYQLVRFAGKSQGPQVLDTNKTLAFYTINEVTLISKKSLAQIELQYGTPSSSDVTDMSSPRSSPMVEPVVKKPINSLLISQSNPDFSSIDDKQVLHHMTNSKQLKKRPAPPPPVSTSATLPNKSFSIQNSANKDENIIERDKNESNVRFNDNVSTTSENIVPTRVSKVQMSVSHVRHNSGSDSSGYHESVLSSDSPESSSASGLHKLADQTEANISNQLSATTALNQKSGLKKRRAPPPPTTQLSENCCAKPINGINDVKLSSNEHIIDESKVVSECMSDVSLPLSTSSSSSGTASDMNNRSLSPIVITQDNGSSTPLQRSVIYNENSLNSESIRCSSTSNKTVDNESQSLDRTDDNECRQNFELKESSESPESGISGISGVSICTNEDQSVKDPADTSSETTLLSKPPTEEPNVVSFETNEIFNEVKARNENEISVNLGESLPKEEVSSEAPVQTLAVSHEPDSSGHEGAQQVAEPNIANRIDNQKSSSNGSCDGIYSLHIFANSSSGGKPTHPNCMRLAYTQQLGLNGTKGCGGTCRQHFL